MTRNKCLVLGGDGFIGSHLVDDLLQRGFDVSVFGRFDGKKTKNLEHVKNAIRFYSGNFSHIPKLEKAIKGMDYVFHFISASTPASTMYNPKQEVTMNVLPTINLLNLCVKNSVKRIIFPSSGGAIYGNVYKGTAHETDLPNPLSPHAISKFIIEKYLHYFFLQYGLDYLIYRISNVYGERQKTYGSQGIISIAIGKGLQGQVVDVYGNTIRDYIHVKDVTEIISRMFDKSHRYKLYNVGSMEGVSLQKLLATIQKITGLTLRLRKLKKRKGDVEAIVLNVDRIKHEFSFEPKVSLEKGIRKTYDWLVKEKKSL